MTLILNGTDNSVSSPAVTGTDTDTGVYYPAANQVALATNGTLALIADASQNVGVSVTPSAWQSTRKALQVGDTSALAYGGNQTTVGNNFFINSSGTNSYIKASTYAHIYIQGSDGSHEWYTAPNTGTAGGSASFTRLLAVNTGKSLALEGASSQTGTGITFPATQSASSDANTLDDYEEGSWTPTFSVGGSTFTGRGWYVKVGVICHIGANNLEGVSAISDGATAIITGLPFNIKQDSGTNNYKYGSGVAILFSDQSDGYNNKPLSGRINPATPVAGSASAAKIDFRNISGVATTTSDPITFGGSYITE